ncbi:DUF1214 domain-containing protein [Pseudomonas citronellolis]|uniref:DUF1214 domain-containing protein n=1 Tax=Pseudomonas citronellolis TaxID=53408 RepID=UPI0020A118CE|nr:DUF1214 domain-containing protein [Pseudomonas citronellolis]MCP1603930.1 hypothetical protein [Pseudomonas citronellolis]MCP1654420.1 hypothetical protein [Pseudomonas citronellolis]MCP1721588.1 hypothetical protein [Pseudomonas citronellolis]
MPTDPIEQEVVSGESWTRFCEQLRRSGEQILRAEAPADAQTRAEGFRYLTRLLRIALEMHLEFADADFPGFITPSHETAKIGADNPDNLYRYARLNGAQRYRVSGTRGSVAYLSFGTQKGGYETDGRMIQTGFIDAGQLQLDADGRFELILSQQPPASGNWLRLEPESNALIVRQTFLDRASEQPAQLRIERLDVGSAPQPLDPQRLQQGLQRAAGFVENTARLFADWAQGYQAHANRLPPADQALCQAVGGDPNIFYYHSYWALAEDEALLIEVEQVPECDFWNLQINNYWMESLDYRYHRICLNKHSAQLDANGGMRLVLSARDPGLPNWLETAGHPHGTLCLRWVGAQRPVHPGTRVVKLTDLKELAP